MFKSTITSIILVIVMSCCALAQVVNVPDDWPSIQLAVNNCPDGGTVVIEPGTYTGADNRNIRINLTTVIKNITITSTDPTNPAIVNATVIDCDNAGRAFVFEMGETNKTVVTGLTIINGNGGAFKDQVGFIGGALYFTNGSSPVISNCVIADSSASFGGAIAVANSGSAPRIKNCWIIGNTAIVGGGAIYTTSSDTVIDNCVIAGNESLQRGGALYCQGAGKPVIVHSTIMANKAQTFAGGIQCFPGPNLTLYGSILWGNIAPVAAQMQVIGTDTTKVNISYCDVQNNDNNIEVLGTAVVDWSLGGNIHADPMFANAVSLSGSTQSVGDFSLPEDSPCVDAGDSMYNPQGQTDIYGNQRLFGEAIDIGAAEFVLGDALHADIRLWPKVINLRGKQNFFFCRIKLDGHESDEIDENSIKLEGIEPILTKKHKHAKELVVRFDMEDIRGLVGDSQATITLKVTGELNDATPFEGTDTLKIYRKHVKWPHEKSDKDDKKDKDEKKGKKDKD